MNNAKDNELFLIWLGHVEARHLLGAIAVHYDATIDTIRKAVTHEDAEWIIEYTTGKDMAKYHELYKQWDSGIARIHALFYDGSDFVPTWHATAAEAMALYPKHNTKIVPRERDFDTWLCLTECSKAKEELFTTRVYLTTPAEETDYPEPPSDDEPPQFYYEDDGYTGSPCWE